MPAPLPAIERLELVTAQAATGDGGNAWGGHQTRIVRTRTGRLYTAYTVSTGAADMARRWRLAERLPKGWVVLAEGAAGREPVNLLAGPDEQIHIVGWPDGLPRLWSVTRNNGKTAVREAAVPGAWARTNWPYGAAGINTRSGDLYVLQSNGDKPGEFRWACRQGKEGRWRFQIVPLAYRHCYAYVLPGAEGGAPPLSLVATRDVLWETLGYTRPEKAFAYVFNAVTCWQSPRRAGGSAAAALRDTPVREEKPTAQFPLVECGNAQTDAYIDMRGRLHVLYWLSGETTQGQVETHHAVLEGDRIIKEVRLPLRGRPYCRFTQDKSGRFYLLSAEDGASELMIHPAVSEDGTSLGAPVSLRLKGHTIVYSGAAIACPRAGVPVEDYVDGVFPSGKGEQWVYFRLRLRGTSTGR